jgi:beta-lactam-binding protein with PASTA domain
MIRKLFVTLVLFVLILCAGFFSSLYLKRALDEYFNRKPVMVPELVGKTALQATRMLQASDANLKLDWSREMESSSAPRDTIIAQDPPPGSVVNSGKTIFLTISKGTRLREVPELLGLDIRRARLLLSEARLKVGKKSYLKSPDRERGIVIMQYPDGKSMAGHGEAVDVVLSDGKAEADVMPRVVWQRLPEARSMLKDVGVSKVDIEYSVSRDHPDDTVIAQDPPPGTPVRADGSSKLSVSRAAGGSASSDSDGGKRKVWVQFDMPPGLTAKLLEVDVTDSVATHRVYSQTHSPGETVRLEISGSGPMTVKFYLDQNPVPVLEQKF